MILPEDRDPRFITIRRGGTLTDSDHRLLALWAATCAEHVLPLFESAQPSDPRPRQAIEQIRVWARGEIRMSQSRAAGGHAMAAVAQRDLLVGVRMLTVLPWPRPIEAPPTVNGTIQRGHGSRAEGHVGVQCDASGNESWLFAGWTVRWVPGSGRSVWSKSVETTTNPIRCPVANT